MHIIVHPWDLNLNQTLRLAVLLMPRYRFKKNLANVEPFYCPNLACCSPPSVRVQSDDPPLYHRPCVIAARLREAPPAVGGSGAPPMFIPPPPLHSEPEPFFSPLLQGFTSGSSATICLLLSVSDGNDHSSRSAAASWPTARLAKRTPRVERTAEG